MVRRRLRAVGAVGALAVGAFFWLAVGNTPAKAEALAGSGLMEITGSSKCYRVNTSTTAASVVLPKSIRYELTAHSVAAVYGIDFNPGAPSTCISAEVDGGPTDGAVTCGADLPVDVPKETAAGATGYVSDAGLAGPTVTFKTASGTGYVTICPITDARGR